MKSKRVVLVAVVIALALTVVLIGAVAAKVVSSLVTDEQNVIRNLHMSDSCEGPDMILFPSDTETVYVVFDYFGMQGQQPYRTAVTDGVELYNHSDSYTGSGTECITVTHTSGPIPPDTYRTQIWAGDYPATPTRLWYLRLGGPGEITNLHMSISPDGPSSTEFMPGTRTIWAVFDYVDMEGNEVGIDVVYQDTGAGIQPPVITAKTSLAGSGTKAISVTHQYLTGFPSDQYRTHVVKDGYVDYIENWSVLHVVYLPLVLKNH
jgi:hypothetical protein